LDHKGTPLTTLVLENTMTATITRPAKVKLPHIEQLAAKLADARNERKKWEQREAELAEQLIQAHQAGIVPTKFQADGWSFLLQEGRKTVIYPAPVLAEIKFIQEAAIASGATETRIGSSFWRITAQKEEA
jgi:hypothetical protein